VLGILLCIAPAPPGSSPSAAVMTPTPGSRDAHTSAWPFVLPAALLALMAGFSGALSILHAAMLLVLGACVWSVWRGTRESHNPVFPPPPVASTHESTRLRAYQFIIALGLGAAGAWMAYKAVVLADERTRVATSGLIAMAVISPLLVLPMLGTGAIAAHHGRFDRALASIIGVVLLNLFLLLPLLVVGHYVSQAAQLAHAAAATAAATTQPTTTQQASETILSLQPMPFPLAVWRVDAVLLIVLGLMLVPVSLGRWPLRRIEGFVLTLLYAAYLIISTTIAVRI